jgi:predicted transcriptional regulator of viral defense system
MGRGLGQLESQFFAYTQLRGLNQVRAGDIARALSLTKSQEFELLRRLVRDGLIARVRRGLFLVPEKLPLGGIWTPDPVEALQALIEDRNGRYQICGPNAFNRYGFDEQVPNQVYAYNNRVSGTRRVGRVVLNLIKVADRRLGDVEETTSQGHRAIYSSRTRTLVDAVYDWSRFSSLPRAFDWIRREIEEARVAPAELAEATVRFGDKGTRRRIGFELEQIGAPEAVLRRILRGLPPTTGPIPWNPTGPKRGPVNQRWGVIVNMES